MRSQKITLVDQKDVVSARQAGREIAKHLGFGPADQTRLATAISEITRNAIQYAGNGTCSIIGSNDNACLKVEVVVEDKGSGIKDIKKAMEDGYSTSRGLGAGLPGAKRLMHEFHLESNSSGTTVKMVMSRRFGSAQHSLR